MQQERITSRRNPGILSAAALTDKKERDKTGLFAVEGHKLLGELLQKGIPVKTLYVTDKAQSRYEAMIGETEKAGAAVFAVSDEVYDRLTEEQSPEGLFAVAKQFPVEKDLSSASFEEGFVILDGVQDPANVGTVIRTACAFGLHQILLSADCADPFNRKTIRASMGTLFAVKLFRSAELPADIIRLRDGGAHVYASALCDDAADIRSVSFRPCDCLVLGSEGRGISAPVLAACDRKLIIPMVPGTESLNAASAAAILMWEKQKGGIA